jgi:hypothetical protein
MPTDSELRQMALDIIDMAYLRLIDDTAKTYLMKIDRSGVLTGHGSASRHELL